MLKNFSIDWLIVWWKFCIICEENKYFPPPTIVESEKLGGNAIINLLVKSTKFFWDSTKHSVFGELFLQPLQVNVWEERIGQDKEAAPSARDGGGLRADKEKHEAETWTQAVSGQFLDPQKIPLH